jgi:hypothetical protein
VPYTERTLYRWLVWVYGGPFVHFQRIETMTGAGIPDVNGCAHGRELWLEGKVARYCRTQEGGDALCFTIRRSQLAWMTKRRQAGGLVWFYVAVPKSLATRIWPLAKHPGAARILAFSPAAVRELLEERTGLGKVTRLEARFGPQEALKLDEWPLVEALLVNKDKAAA